MIETDELTEFDLAVYASVIPPPGLSVESLEHALNRSHVDVMSSLTRLAEVCLVRRDDDLRYIAVSPGLAEAEALGREELELSARRASVESRRNAIRKVLPSWTGSIRTQIDAAAVDVITDPDAIANVLMHFAERSQREVLSVAPGRGASRVDLRTTRMANIYSLDRGVRTRALYQHSAMRDRSTRALLIELAEHGARIRTTSSVPGRSLVIDREVALLPIPTDDPATPGLAIVREPNVIAWIVASFEQLWSEATTLEDLLGTANAGGELDQTRAAILRLMGEGEKDEAISRRLSISVRTCRRHIADYMAQVGATSRFQAGVIAAREGHLDHPIG